MTPTKLIVLGGAAGIVTAVLAARRYHSKRPQVLHLTLVGFGAVNRALARLIAKDAPRLAKEHNMVVMYSAIIARHGAWEAVDSESELSAVEVAALADQVQPLRHSAPRRMRSHPSPLSVESIRSIVSRTASFRGPRCLAEAIDVDYEAGEPATTYLSCALRGGSHAVSANKGPVVHHLEELEAIAARAGVRYLYESAVMDGVPIFACWRAGFQPGGAQLRGFRGCLNSTTSVVLSGMYEGKSMEVALRRAQEAGIAEADPSGDLSGMDAAVKVVALARALALHRADGGGDGVADAPPLTLRDVHVQGIEHVTLEQVREAARRGAKLRLVAGASAHTAADGARGLSAYVRLEQLQPGDPLYSLDGADAAVMLQTDRLADVTIVQTGSVVEDTAFGVWADVLRACCPRPA